MKYFLDTEFHEYRKKTLFGNPIDTIELISIGIVSEDGREYYAICKDFDLKTAWKNKWLKEHVLRPIFIELNQKMNPHYKTYHYHLTNKFCYKHMKRLIKYQGKSKKEIAKDIINFTLDNRVDNVIPIGESDSFGSNPEFYAYYADYDWVVFCWIFGRMIDLPKGFPMYCKDLKQILDDEWKFRSDYKEAKYHHNYPKQENEHNALEDAKWNKKLYDFLKAIK